MRRNHETSYVETVVSRGLPRCNQPWYLNGKHNECEKYQISLLEDITGIKVDKTNKLEDGLKTLMVIN